MDKPMTKSQLKDAIATKMGIEGKVAAQFLDEFFHIAADQLKGIGSFTIPGLAKLNRVTKKATPEKMGRNPKTGEPMTISAKPEKNVVKARILKALKDAVL